MTDLRGERRAATRDRIVRAMLGLLVDRDPASVSMPAVAEASGVSLRTVYRHFPNKPELLDAAGAWFDEREWAAAAGRNDIEELRADEFLVYQRARFADFDANRPGVLAQLSTAWGRELRRQRLPPQRQATRELSRRLVPSLDDTDADRLADAIIATASSSTFVELVDRLGLDADEAAGLTVWMVEALTAHARTTGTTRPRASADEEASVP